MTLDPDRLTALLAAASPRPWRVSGEHTDPGDPDWIGIDNIEDTTGDRIVETDSGVYPPNKIDADIIVAAVNALPELLEVYASALAWRQSDECDDETPHGLAGELIGAIDRADGNSLTRPAGSDE